MVSTKTPQIVASPSAGDRRSPGTLRQYRPKRLLFPANLVQMNRLGLFACIGGSSLVGAQVPVMTDNQLYAAYCAGVIADRLEVLSRAPADANPKKVQSLIQYEKQRQLRFLDYLAATGAVSTGPGEQRAEGAYQALQRGRMEGAQCSAAIHECDAQGVNKREPCIGGHFMNLPPCSQTNRCDYPDNLPF
jgi:hypothetical protein